MRVFYRFNLNDLDAFKFTPPPSKVGIGSWLMVNNILQFL